MLLNRSGFRLPSRFVPRMLNYVRTQCLVILMAYTFRPSAPAAWSRSAHFQPVACEHGYEVQERTKERKKNIFCLSPHLIRRVNKSTKLILIVAKCVKRTNWINVIFKMYLSKNKQGLKKLRLIVLQFYKESYTVPSKKQPNNNHVQTWNRKLVKPRVIDSPNLSPDTQLKVTVIARPPFTPVA
jgi:hypothetical protein